MAYYHTCSRCGCTMDTGEGINYPGEGRVCEECAQELEEIKKELTGFMIWAEGTA